MTKLIILSPDKQRDFDAPSKLNAKKRTTYFSLDYDMLEFVKSLRTPTNQVGFVLQLGYFRANRKFFTHHQFKSPDIDYVLKMLNILPTEINLSTYVKKIPTDHRKKILEFLQWQPLNSENQEKIKHHIEWNIPLQLTLKRVFYAALEYCCHHKIEIPSYHFLAQTITHAYNTVENKLIHDITQKLTDEHREKLDYILHADEIKGITRNDLPSLAHLKKINQSFRPMDIKVARAEFELFKKYFTIFHPILNELNLSDQMIEYFATWVQKAPSQQLNAFPNKHKTYLRLLYYITHQFYIRHDMLADIYLKSVQNSLNASSRSENQRDKKERKERNHAIQKVVSTNMNARQALEEITRLIDLPERSSLEKLESIKTFVYAYNAQHPNDEKIKIMNYEQTLTNISTDQHRFDSLEKVSRKLQLRISELLKLLTFDEKISQPKLLAAIRHFVAVDGNLERHAPMDFLNTKEIAMCTKDGQFRPSLYKILFFIHVASGIKSGDLNLLYSYRYKAVQHYLIDDKTWEREQNELIKAAGLEKFASFQSYLPLLQETLNTHYKTVNERFIANENPHLTVDDKYRLNLKTPSIDSSTEKYASTLLAQAGYVPLVKILSDINQLTNFTASFKHHSVKHAKMKPQPEMIYAGITGIGRNMNLTNLANASVGINGEALHNCVNWCFSVANIHSASRKVTRMMEKIFLSSAFQYESSKIHSSSDGRKVTVAVDSILASHSYKYFGKEKGVTFYMFIDERNILFYSLVMSSAEREAAYVIDGLLHNRVIKSDIHSTDEHGYTDIIFAVTHFMDILNAPRPKNINRQKLYGFTGRKTYKRMGYKILPSRGVHIKLIEANWNTILRFMTTIKLKYTPASYLLKRLSSYAKEHPLYKALKEFGRIIKSIFLLMYIDDVNLRQRIEKQLNKIEFANRFSKAIIGDNKQELAVGEKEEQEMMIGCNVLIQNCITLWNLLYLAQVIVNNENPLEQKKMVDQLAKGSSVNWGHVNFQGEFDFFKYSAANQNSFDLEKILTFKLAG